MKDYRKAVQDTGIGRTPQLCQDAMIEMLKELFDGNLYNGQEGRKPLKFFKQDLPIPTGFDDDIDTDKSSAPYILVQMTGGEIADDNSPQTVDFSIVICAYDEGIDREGYQDVCSAPYFGGSFTILKPIAWALQADKSDPYYYGACVLTCTAPAMTQDSVLKELI